MRGRATASGPGGGGWRLLPSPSCRPGRQKLRQGVAANFSFCLSEVQRREGTRFFSGTIWSVAYQNREKKNFPWQPLEHFLKNLLFFFLTRKRSANFKQLLTLQPLPTLPPTVTSVTCGVVVDLRAATLPLPRPLPHRTRGLLLGKVLRARRGPARLVTSPRRRRQPLLSPPHAAGSPGRRLEPGSASHGPGNRFYFNVRCYFYSSWVRPAS